MKMKALLFLALPLLYAASCKDEISKSTALSAIPVRSTFVVRINNVHQLNSDLQESVPGTVLKESIVFSNLSNFVSLLDGFNNDKAQNIRGFGAFDQYGAGTFGWLWTIESEDVPFINETALATFGNTSSRIYGSSKIIHFTNDDLDFFFAKQNGLVLLSEHENLVEASLKQLESGINLSDDAHFMHTLKTTNSKDPINVFVQYKSMPEWLNTLLLETTEWPGKMATWSALDLDINKNDINFTGISLVPDTAITYLGLFANCGQGSANFTEIIPQNAALAISQSCNDLDTWQANFSEYLGKVNKLKKRNIQLENMAVNPENWMAFVDEELGVFYSDGAVNSAESKNGFIRILDTELASNALNSASGDFIENYREIDIKKLNKRHALPLLFGKLFSHLSEPYWFYHNNWVIFSNNLANAKSTINNLLAEKTWYNAEDFKPVESLLDDNAHILAVAKNMEWYNLAQKELNTENAKKLGSSASQMEKINWAVIQIKQKNEAAYTELVLLHQTETEQIAKQYWSHKLDAEAASRPQLVYNHHTKSNDVFVQDKNNIIYLINAQGKTLWKNQVDGAILGEVDQVDLYKNNKFQLVFNTAQSIYILDRNGKNVGNFPVKLPKTATAPMATLDYENTRKYRFIVPCQNRLYNFDGDGKEVDGWEFKKAKSTLIAKPKHDVIGTKDYIYTADDEGNVYLLNRRGEIRQPIKSQLKNLASQIYLVPDKTVGGKLSALSKSGYVLNLIIDDQIDSLQAFKESPKFMSAKNKSQLLASENYVFKRDDDSNFDIEFNEEIIYEPRIYTVGKDTFISVTTKNNQIWIYDWKGNPLPGMPLYGTGTATVGKTNDKDVHVIVATEDGAILDYKLMQD